MNLIQMGASIKAEAMSHLEKASDKAITEMAKNGSVGVILPTTVYNLRLEAPPVRRMIEAGVPIALGSDFNPNAFCLSMVCQLRLLRTSFSYFSKYRNLKGLRALCNYSSSFSHW